MRTLLVAVLALSSLLVSSSVIAQAPELISYQAYLTNPAGIPIDGTVDLKLRLYSITGSLLWSLDTTGVEVNGGITNLFIGAGGTPASLRTVPFNGRQFLTMSVNDDPIMVTQLVSAPFALGMRGMYAVYRDDGNRQSYNVVGGAANNSVPTGVVGATIGGGGGTSFNSPVQNAVTGNWGTVGGGRQNTASGRNGTIGGGASNTASGLEATVGGGRQNTASGFAATVGGGDSNTASGDYAAIPGGLENSARGTASFAAGRRAHANDYGAFVWQDATALLVRDSLNSTANNQFLARASGGFFFYTNASPNLAVGTSLPAGSGTWGVLSSKASKTDFQDVDTRNYLDRVASLGVLPRFSGQLS